MWIDKHPYFAIYLLGSVCVFLLILVKLVWYYFLDWFLRANVLRKNLKKLAEPSKKTLLQTALLFVGTVLFEMALSWINVPVALWQIVTITLRTVRDSLVSVPEEIKSIRFPLKTNPDLSREAVWAIVVALKIKNQAVAPNVGNLLSALREVTEYYPDFNRGDALQRLERLDVVEKEVIANAAEGELEPLF